MSKLIVFRELPPGLNNNEHQALVIRTSYPVCAHRLSLLCALPTEHRVFSVGTEHRVFSVGTEHRVFSVGTGHRVFSVGTEHRVFSVGTEHRVFSVGTEHRVFSVGTEYRAGARNLRPYGRMRPRKGKLAAVDAY